MVRLIQNLKCQTFFQDLHQFISKYYLILHEKLACLNPYNVLRSGSILVVHSPIKNHTLQFYLDIIFVNQKKQDYFINICFFSIFIANKFSVKNFVV